MKKAAENSIEGRRIYIIEIMPKWHSLVAPDLPEGKRCFYVGETGKPIKERYWEHRTGNVKPGRRSKRTAVFTKMRNSQDGEPLLPKIDVKLRRRMSEAFPSVETQDDSEALEAVVIDGLRRDGHAVHPKGPGDIDFEDYKSVAVSN